MFRVIGPRVLIKPIETPRSSVLELTDRQIPMIGRVVGIGQARCPDCGSPVPPDVALQALVVVPPTAGQEITVNGESYWLVNMEDVGAEWRES